MRVWTRCKPMAIRKRQHPVRTKARSDAVRPGQRLYMLWSSLSLKYPTNSRYIWILIRSRISRRAFDVYYRATVELFCGFDFPARQSVFFNSFEIMYVSMWRNPATMRSVVLLGIFTCLSVVHFELGCVLRFLTRVGGIPDACVQD